jgi:hypothetical protein
LRNHLENLLQVSKHDVKEAEKRARMAAEAGDDLIRRERGRFADELKRRENLQKNQNMLFEDFLAEREVLFLF